MSKKKLETLVPVSDKDTRSRAIVAKWLSSKAPVVGALDRFPELGDEKYLALGVGARNMINGRIFGFGEKISAAIDCFGVSKQLQGKGIGERLLKAYFVECRDNGATELWSDAVSNMALALRIKVLGAENLHFYDCEYPQYGFLPLTVEQVQMSNDRIDQLDLDQPDRPAPQGHVGIYVNLEDIHMAEWEAPQLVYSRG